jgi:hypothetical protein
MTRFLFALMALGLLGAAPQASAACRWFGSQLECDLGGSQLLVGTQASAEPAYAGAVRPQPVQGRDELLDHGAVPERPLRLDLQNVGVDPGSCRRIGNETYCY